MNYLPKAYDLNELLARNRFKCEAGPQPKPQHPRPYNGQSMRSWGGVFKVVDGQDKIALIELADAFERNTRRKHAQGALKQSGRAVWRALILGFLNWKTGQLDPSIEKIAQWACISERSVSRGLNALREAGLLSWVNRIAVVVRNGIRQTAQISNAYRIGTKAPCQKVAQTTLLKFSLVQEVKERRVKALCQTLRAVATGTGWPLEVLQRYELGDLT